MKNIFLFAAIGIIVIIQIATLSLQFGGEKRLSGTTADDWNVGGNLAITGTSAFTGASTFGTAGTAFAKFIATTTNVNYPAVEANGCEEATTTIMSGGTTHAFAGNELVMIGIDNSLASTNTDITFLGFIASDDDVGIRMCNASTTATGNYTAVDLRIGVFDY